MDLRKHSEFFSPAEVNDKLHIIGCGAVGSTLAENLVRLGLTNLVLYDFDFVESKNVTNQMFRAIDIGKQKTEALRDILVEINPDLEKTIELHDKYEGQSLDGYVFLAVDNIEIRRSIVKNNQFNMNIKAMFDFRMGLEVSQHYAADWKSVDMQENLLASMDFTQEEAESQTPRTACNETLSVVFTIRAIVAAGVENFVYFTLDNNNLKRSIFHNAKTMENLVFDRNDFFVR